MKIAVIGTGMVGRALAARLSSLGHDIVIGTRVPSVTLTRTPSDTGSIAPYAQWQPENPAISLLSLPDAGAHGEVVINATNGQHVLPALAGVGAEPLAGKVLLDLAPPIGPVRRIPANPHDRQH